MISGSQPGPGADNSAHNAGAAEPGPAAGPPAPPEPAHAGPLTLRGERASQKWPRTSETWRRFRAESSEESFAHFYDETNGFIFTVAMRMLNNREQAQDVMQSVYTHLVELASHENCPDVIDEVIYRLAVREADLRRSHLRRSRAREAEPEAVSALADARPPVPELLHQQRLSRTVMQALHDLPEEVRLPLQLHYLQGLTHEEVAERLSVSRNRASYLIYRSLARLQRVLRRKGITESALALVVALGAARRQLAPPAEWKGSDTYRIARARLDSPAGGGASPAPPPSLPRFRFRGAPVGAGLLTALAAVVFWFLLPPPRQHSASAPSHSPAAGSRILSPDSSSPSPTPRPASPQRGRSSASVSGRVLSMKDGSPLPHVPVVFEKPGENPVELTTRADGTFDSRNTLRPGAWTVVFNPAPPYAVQRRSFEILAGTAFDLGDVRLRRLGTIRGRVVREDTGAGVAGQNVVIRNAYEPTRVENRLTGPDGRFEFTGLPYDKYALLLDRHAHQAFYVVILPDGEVREVDIPLGQGTVDAVLIRAGKPCPDAGFFLRREFGEDQFSFVEWTGAAGRCVIGDLAAGRYRIEASPIDKSLSNQKVVRYVDLEGTGTRHLEVILPSGRLTGRIQFPDGRPAGGAAVRAVPAQDAADETFRFPSVEAETSSTADGTFVLDGLPPGPYLAVASLGDGPAAVLSNIEVPQEGDSPPALFTLGKKPGATVRVSAFDQKTGQPIAGMWCDVHTSAGRLRWPRTVLPDGFLLLRDVPPGPATLEISAHGYSSDIRKVTLRAGQTLECVSELFEAGGVTWTVVGADTLPVPGASCLMEPVSEDRDGGADRHENRDAEQAIAGTTDKAGVWTVRGLRPGQYRFSAFRDTAFAVRDIEIHAHNLSNPRVQLEETETSSPLTSLPDR